MVKKYLALFLLSGLFLYSCGSSGGDKQIRIDGSSTVFPITEAVAEEFRSVAPGIRITVGASGTGGGFQKFLRGETVINNASRGIQPSEKKLAEKNGIDYLRLSVAYDGIAVVVNPQNNWVDHLTLQQLETIWKPSAQDSITHWSDINENWPNEQLHLYGPGVASGTYDYFTKVIVGESGSSRGDFTASEDDNVLVQGVSTDKYALGFFGLAYFEENQNKLRLIPVKNDSGNVVKPTLETVGNNTYRPLSRPLFIYVSEAGAQRESVQKFVNFYLDNAGKLAKQIGYVPMPDSAYQAQKQKFQNFVSSVSAEADSSASEK